MGGIGIAVLLCALMAFMPMTSLVDNTATETVSNAEIVSEVDDFFKLPAAIEQTTYEYDAAQELLGMRQANTKGFLTEDGRIAQLTSDEPMHYLADSGAFEDINLNITCCWSSMVRHWCSSCDIDCNEHWVQTCDDWIDELVWLDAHTTGNFSTEGCCEDVLFHFPAFLRCHDVEVDVLKGSTVSNAEIVSEVDDFFKLPATIEHLESLNVLAWCKKLMLVTANLTTK